MRIIFVLLAALVLVGCGPRIDESGGPAPVDSHGQPILCSSPDGCIAEPTPLPAWAIHQMKVERVEKARRELAEAEADLRAELAKNDLTPEDRAWLASHQRK